MLEDVPAFTPVTLLTGFLGSGKTTLLRRLLADPALGDTAVIINELGEVGIDHLLVERLDDQMVLLKSGCVCCTVRGELATAMRDLHSRRERGTMPPFRRLVIESTGLADPFPVLSTLKADPVLRHHFRSAGRHHHRGRGQRDASARSPHRIGTPGRDRRCHRADQDRSCRSGGHGAAGGAARRHEPFRAAAIRRRSLPRCGRSLAIGQQQRRSRRSRSSPWGTAAHRGVSAFSIIVDEPLDWTAFGIWLTMLLNRHGERILRVKGILALAGEERPVAVHGVQHLVHAPTHLSHWPSDDHRSRLVFIVEGIEPDLIRRSFSVFNRLELCLAA